MKTTLRAALLSFGAGACLRPRLPAHAHHSFPAQYDVAKPITLTGKVTKVEWTNPHIFIYIDVPNETTGAVVNWALEMGGPNALLRLGWKRDSLKTDDLITDRREPRARRQPAREREGDHDGRDGEEDARGLERRRGHRGDALAAAGDRRILVRQHRYLRAHGIRTRPSPLGSCPSNPRQIAALAGRTVP